MNSVLKSRALKLRRNSSQVERIMWSLLRNRKLNYKFRRQYIIPPYIVDFVCLQKKLIIELDGDHHAYQKEYDEKRTCYLESLGYKVIRFSNAEIFNDRADHVLSIINQVLED